MITSLTLRSTTLKTPLSSSFFSHFPLFATHTRLHTTSSIFPFVSRLSVYIPTKSFLSKSRIFYNPLSLYLKPLS